MRVRLKSITDIFIHKSRATRSLNRPQNHDESNLRLIFAPTAGVSQIGSVNWEAKIRLPYWLTDLNFHGEIANAFKRHQRKTWILKKPGRSYCGKWVLIRGRQQGGSEPRGLLTEPIYRVLQGWGTWGVIIFYFRNYEI